MSRDLDRLLSQADSALAALDRHGEQLARAVASLQQGLDAVSRMVDQLIEARADLIEAGGEPERDQADWDRRVAKNMERLQAQANNQES
ncbi:MAG: hypothetical protein IT537_30540 [Hyphomicrobiales bacterium]|nr:hypothetical protein [Hyphomicrobiales bacterium]